ncbi:hypothetical protein BLA29_008792 [Euroglyphus maynei]|uniref:Uncharacterized protein n=1 Tax=Euroglyphus maynei TaxID=6958 RepID=A0A1Y3BD41_EURMA|nr:hypothetical protein BLA29_008792 [Euroglyphus maynei]
MTTFEKELINISCVKNNNNNNIWNIWINGHATHNEKNRNPKTRIKPVKQKIDNN